MPSIFAQGEAMLDRMFEMSSVPVSYLRNGRIVASGIPAKIGKTLFRTDDIASGVTMRQELRDFIVRARDIADADVPKKGDEIAWDGKVYLVSAPDGEPCWRWHTRQSHTQMRIHAKYFGEQEKSE